LPALQLLDCSNEAHIHTRGHGEHVSAKCAKGQRLQSRFKCSRFCHEFWSIHLAHSALDLCYCTEKHELNKMQAAPACGVECSPRSTASGSATACHRLHHKALLPASQVTTLTCLFCANCTCPWFTVVLLQCTGRLLSFLLSFCFSVE
jgi:hypothetical protein